MGRGEHGCEDAGHCSSEMRSPTINWDRGKGAWSVARKEDARHMEGYSYI